MHDVRQVKIVGVRDYVSVRRYRCASSEDCDNVMVALECLVRRAWQSLCESSIMPAPEIYQAHAFVDKLNRKGVLQNRVLAVSNEWVYNLECGYGPVTIKNAKVPCSDGFDLPGQCSAIGLPVGSPDQSDRRAERV